MGSELGVWAKPSLGQRAGAVAVPVMLALLLLSPPAVVTITCAQDAGAQPAENQLTENQISENHVLIETWTGDVQVLAAWQLIETWTGVILENQGTDNQVVIEAMFDRRLSGDRVGQHKVPPLSSVNMTITATVSSQVDNAILADYFPSGWTVTDANGGAVSVHDENYDKIEWSVGSISDSVSRSYVTRSPQLTLPPTKYYFHSELTYEGGSATSDDWMVIVADPYDYDVTYTFPDYATANDGSWTYTASGGRNGLQNAGGFAGYWTWDQNTTPSSGVGPLHGVDGDPEGYVFTESSSPTAVDENFVMTLTNAVDASQYALSVSFYYSQDFNGDPGELYFEVWDGDSWEQVFFNNSPCDVADWVQVDNDLSAYTNSDFKIRFRTIVKGTAWRNDCGIDNVRIYGNCRTIPPQKPVLVSPLDGLVTSDNTPTFVWGNGLGADNHRIEVDNDSDFSSVIDNVTVFDNTWTKLSPGYAEDNYYWRVWAVNADGENCSDNTWIFEVVFLPPSKPQLYLPSDGAFTNDSTPTLEWTNGTDADNHHLLIDVSPPDWSGCAIDTWLTMPDNTHTPTTGLADDNYSWKVIAVNPYGENESADIWTFVVDTDAPDAPTLLSPSDGTKTNVASQTFDWSDVTDPSGITYEIWIDNDSDFSSPENLENISNSQYDTTLADENYSWRVKVYDGVAYENESDTWTILIDTVAPSAPTLELPADGAITSDNTPTFDWSDISDAENYDLIVDDDAGFPSPEIQETISVSTYTPTTELADENYFWKVIVRDLVGNENESMVWTFLIDTQSSYTYVATYDNVKGTVENFDNQKQEGNGYSMLHEGVSEGEEGEKNISVAQLVCNAGSPDAQDMAWNTWLINRDFISSVTYLSAIDVTKEQLETYDVVFMCYSVIEEPNVATAVKPANVGVMFVNRRAYNTMKFGTGHNYVNGQTQVTIVDNSHYITSPYPEDNVTYTASDAESYISGWSGDIQCLGKIPGQATQASILVLDKGKKHVDSSIAPERRVFSGLGYFGPANMNENGDKLNERALRWVIRAYSLNIYENIENVPSGDNHYLEILYKLDNIKDNFRVQVWNGTSWENRGEILDSTSWEFWSYKLLDNEFTGDGDDVQIRFVDVDNESVKPNAILKDYLRVRTVLLVAPQWQVIETWTGTVQAPVGWNLIESWTGTIQAPAAWQVIETWTGNVSALVEWQLIESWTGTVSAPVAWQVIETWTGTVSAPVAWRLIESWTGTVSAPAQWGLIETWTGTVSAPAGWQLVETWTGTVLAPAQWQAIETWTGTVSAPAGWQVLETWTGTFAAPVAWQLIETWTGTVSAPAAWSLIESWTGAASAPAAWQLVDTWTGTVQTPVGWNLIESWTGTIQAPAAWQVIGTWTGIVSAPAEWQLIESWTGTIEAFAEWQVIESWMGTVQAPVGWQLIEMWTGTVQAPTEWQVIETWMGTVSAPAAWQLIETWTGTVSTPAAWKLIDTWTGTVEAPAAWQVIEKWTGTVEAPVAWQLIETWMGTVSASAVWQVIETLTGTVEAPAAWQVVETWTGTVSAPAQWGLIETWTCTVSAPVAWSLIESWTGTVSAPVAWQVIETWTGTVKAVGTPNSSIGATSPYWQTSAPYVVTAIASDPDGTLVTVALWYRYSAKGSNWSAWTRFGADNESPWAWSFTAPENDGYYEFYSVAKDNDNNEELAPAVADVQYGVDRVAPTITSVVINDNASSTSSVEVTISIDASDAISGLAEMRFSLNNFEWSDWKNFVASKSYTIPTGDGLKTVYVQVKDKAGLPSTVASDSITLETVAPPAPIPPVVVPPLSLIIPTPAPVLPIFFVLLAIFLVGVSGLALYRALMWRIKPFVSLKSLKRVVPARPAVNLARLKVLWRIKPAISLKRMMPAPITLASDLPTGPFKPIPVVTRPPAVGPMRFAPKAMAPSEILKHLKLAPRPSKPRISLKRLKREVFKKKKRRRS